MSAFIVIEGLEGAGKSTVIAAVIAFLQEKGNEVIATREPGGTPMAEAIRECVKHDWHDETVTQETELLLMYAARSQLVHNVIKPALQDNKFVVGDRHDMSSVAYQGGGRQVPLSTLAQLKEMTLHQFAPQFTLYLDIEPSVGLARARGRGELDRIEQAGLDFFERARATYLEQIALLKQHNPNSACLVDAHQTVEEVRQQVLESLSTWYAKEYE